MSGFQFPSFGFRSTTDQQGYGSPKNFSTPVYQPMPAVGTPSFGGLGRPLTPKETSRHSSHSSYSSKDAEPVVQPLPPSVERARRHRDYYLEGGDIYFLVENYLFRVHKYFFERESAVFKKQFAEIAVSGHHRLGSSDNDPIVLHDVQVDDFSRFLWVFYNPIYSIYDATTEDWAAILGLAHHWQFPEVKALVVRELEKQVIVSIYKIIIYHRYNVDRGLLLSSYTDLVSREEALSYDEAKDLGLETSLMIMTAREIVRKGNAPTSTVNVSTEELRNIIRQVFRFPGLRSDSPLSDITAAEPVLDHRSPPHLSEKTELPTVFENENEPLTFTTSASLNTPLQPPSEPQAPIISTPTPPAPAPSNPKQSPTKQKSATSKKEDNKPASVSPPKEEPKQKEVPPKTASVLGPDGKPKVQEPVQPATEEKSKPDPQDNKKKPLSARLADVGKGSSGPTSANDGDKPADDKKGAKDARDATDAKNITGSLGSGQDLNGTPLGTPIGTPLVDPDQPGTPTPGQSAKKTKALLAQAAKIRRKEAQEMQTTSSSNNNNKAKGKETIQEQSPASIGSEPGVRESEAKTGVDGKGKRVAGDERWEKKSEEVVGVDISRGGVKDEKRDHDGQDAQKSGDDAKATPPPPTTAPGSGTSTVTTDDAMKTQVNPIKEEKARPALDEKTTKKKEGIESSKQLSAEPVVADEGDVATPKRLTKELPGSPAKSIKEKLVPSLGLTVPKFPKNGSAPDSAATATLSPLQKALNAAQDETLMERMARLKIGDASYQPPKDAAPPAHTDLESESECVTAPSGPSTPRSRAGRGSFNLMLRSEVPLSDDDDFFLDCDSNASVSNFDGV